MSAGQPDAVCTCGTAGDAFVPAGHYRDCPQYETPAANQPDAECVECGLAGGQSWWCLLELGHSDRCVPRPGTAAGQPTSDADRIVAYRSPGGRVLRCLAHAPDPRLIGTDLLPVTAEDLPDGGLCTYPTAIDQACGIDVLIPQPTPAA